MALSSQKNLHLTLQHRYAQLMQLSDTELRIGNSNDRVDFENDPAYGGSDVWTKSRIEQRIISESAYTNARFHSFKDSIFDSIARYYHNSAAARDLLHRYQHRIPDLNQFGKEQRYLYEQRCATGTKHSLGILENALDIMGTCTGVYYPLPAPGTARIERAPRLDEIESGEDN